MDKIVVKTSGLLKYNCRRHAFNRQSYTRCYGSRGQANIVIVIPSHTYGVVVILLMVIYRSFAVWQ